MSTLLWTAFALGLAGSFHCLGMCGPLLMALPAGENSRLKFLKNRLIYNAGRIMSYAFLGGVLGISGQGLALAGYQNTLSIATGVLIILILVIPKSFLARFQSFSLVSRPSALVKEAFSKSFKNQKGGKLMFSAGLLNGLLPCGLVYAALAGAFVSSNIWQGMLYMALFGLGTTPLLLVLVWSKTYFQSLVKLRIGKLVPVFTMVLALLFILRGLSLGIPYVSPKVSTTQAGEVEYSCH